jgi:peptidoglycan/xylan/chitin deacetylase (PgdA/CDA1 family)
MHYLFTLNLLAMLKFLFKPAVQVLIISFCILTTHTNVLGQITIAKWKGNKKAAISIGSDDGMVRSIKSSWTLQKPDVPYDGYYKLTQEYHISMTFFIDGRQLDDHAYKPFSSYSPISQPAGSSGDWKDWKCMHDSGHEIASHTYSHANLKSGEIPSKAEISNEIVQNNTRIYENIGEIPISFNMPFTGAFSNVWPIVRDYYPIVTNDLWKEKDHSYFDITESTQQGELEAMLRVALKKGNWMTAVGHGIRTALGRNEESIPDFSINGSMWDGFSPIDYNVLEAFFRFAHSKEDSLFIGTFKDVGRYKMERDSSKTTIVSDTASKLVIEVSHNLKPIYIFVYPLTIKIPINEYKIDNAIQDGVYLKVVKDSEYYLINVIPNGGNIIVSLDKNDSL